MSKISIALTNYNRTDMVIDSFMDVLNNENIDEILISDDHSSIENYNKLLSMIVSIDNDKIKLIRNTKNVKPFLNKYNSVKNCRNEWVILLDSDNKISNEYVDTLSKLILKNNVAYFSQIIDRQNFINVDSPEMWDFYLISDIEFNKNNISDILEGGKLSNERSCLGNPSSDVILNQGNFFVNRDEYIRVMEQSLINVDYKIANTGLDGIYFFLFWLRSNNGIMVVPGLKYYHRIHDGSWYLNNSQKSSDHIKYLVQKIREI